MPLQIRTGVEWINQFHPDPCEQHNLNYRDDHAEGFIQQMSAHGHTWVFDWGNDNAWEQDFRHPDHGGDSLNWTDNVHFVFYSDHGGNWDNIMHIGFSSQCDYCIGSSNEWHLGAKMLKWLVLDCCQGVLDGTREHVIAVWGGPMRGIHMIFTFMRNGHDSSSTADMGSNFGHDAATGSRLANAWIDRAYSAGLDDNPIAIAAGATQDEAINRRENETINWRDYDVSATNWLAWKWRD